MLAMLLTVRPFLIGVMAEPILECIFNRDRLKPFIFPDPSHQGGIIALFQPSSTLRRLFPSFGKRHPPLLAGIGAQSQVFCLA
ncbi:hypothetical protein VO68_19990 [Aeromonas salmonicida]|nr:hypothetical protein VO68_19990 [Aeromonas salmonicida]